MPNPEEETVAAERAPSSPGPPTSLAADSPDPLPQRTFALILIATATWATYTVIDGFEGHRIGFRVNVIAAAGTGLFALWVRRRPERAPLCAHATVAVSAAGMVATALLTGHTRSPTVWFLGCIPLFVGYLRGARATIVWTAVTFACVVLVEVWRQIAPISPEYLIEGADFAGRIVTLVAVIAAFTLATARIHREQLGRLQDRKDTIRELLGQAQRRAEELAIARDAALDASRAKGNFLAVMSHEIRTPLNAVLGLAGLLLDGPLPREQRDIVRTIRSSGDALLSLLNDILDFSKIEAGRMMLEQAPFDVGQCVEDALDLFAPAAAEKDIDLHCHIEPSVPQRVLGDATRVRQILVNLVSNAVKFTAEGSIEVRAAAAPTGAPDTLEIHFTVRDTGIGIPAERIKDLFDQFSQVDASTTRRFGGTGLGLAICRALAERMGGRVWAESDRLKGSTFHVTLKAQVAMSTAEEISLGGTSHVVVLTRREGTRDAVVEQAAEMGLVAVPCATVSEVADAMAAESAHLLIADEASATDELRAALEALDNPPSVVLLTTSGRDTEARRQLRDEWPDAATVAIPPRRTQLRDAMLQKLKGREPPSSRDSGQPLLAAELPLRILVAEDNPVNQMVMQLLLERLGYRADMVGNGVEAVAAVHERPYDLVLMDMRMPEMDGLDAARRIRGEVPAHRQPRIVALTANVTAEDRLQCQEAGMDDFIAKPVVSSELVRAITGGQPRRRSSRNRDKLPPNEMLDVLRRLTEGNDGLLEEIVEEYIATTAKHLDELASALSRSSLKAAATAAHAIKGSSGQLGAAAVMRRAEMIEKAAKAGDGSAAKQELPLLLREQELAIEALRAAR